MLLSLVSQIFLVRKKGELFTFEVVYHVWWKPCTCLMGTSMCKVILSWVWFRQILYLIIDLFFLSLHRWAVHIWSCFFMCVGNLHSSSCQCLLFSLPVVKWPLLFYKPSFVGFCLRCTTICGRTWFPDSYHENAMFFIDSIIQNSSNQMELRRWPLAPTLHALWERRSLCFTT